MLASIATGGATEEECEDEKVNEANDLNPNPDMTVIMTKKDEPMLSERVD